MSAQNDCDTDYDCTNQAERISFGLQLIIALFLLVKLQLNLLAIYQWKHRYGVMHQHRRLYCVTVLLLLSTTCRIASYACALFHSYDLENEGLHFTNLGFQTLNLAFLILAFTVAAKIWVKLNKANYYRTVSPRIFLGILIFVSFSWVVCVLSLFGAFISTVLQRDENFL